VVEQLAVNVGAAGDIVLTGKSYQRSSGSGSFALDTFSGQLSPDGQAITGSYVDASGNRGQWSVTKTSGASASEHAAQAEIRSASQIVDRSNEASADVSSTVYEAEDARLDGAARVCFDHGGFSGKGFVCGFGAEGAGNSNATIEVTAAEAGEYHVTLRYANGTPSPMTLSIYLNGVKIRQTILPSLGTWESWADKEDILQLSGGRNAISYRFDLGDTGNVNIDTIRVGRARTSGQDVQRSPSEREPATLVVRPMVPPQRPSAARAPRAPARGQLSDTKPSTETPAVIASGSTPSTTASPPAPAPRVESEPDAKSLFLSNRYSEAIEAARRGLALRPDPALKLVAAYSYLQLNRGTEALPLIGEAVDSGEIAQFPIRHHHRNLRVSILSGGFLRISRQGIHFRSTGVYSVDSFSVLWADIKNSEVSRFDKKNPEVVALNLEVRLDPNKPGKTRTFNFFPAAANTVDGDVVCSACAQYVTTLNTLVERYRRGAGAAIAAGRGVGSVIGGVYSGQASDSSGPGKMTWTLTRTGDTIAGPVSALDQRGTTAFNGELRGTISGTSITFTIQVPQGGISEYPTCSVSMSGSASVDDQVISGVYAGLSTCSKPLKDGKFALLKE
jgi:hypothetical protein